MTAEALPRWTLAFFLAWASIGLVAAYFLHRRGHDLRPAAALGFVFGPLFIPLAVDAARHRERGVGPVRLSAGAPARGPVDVLVGLGGMGDAVTAVLLVMQLLGPRVGRLTLARTIDFESAESDEWPDAKREAALELEVTSALLPGPAPSTVLLPGDPVTALTTHAAEEGYDLLVVVSSRRWRHLCRRGPAASGGRAGVPVLMVGAPSAGDR